MALGLAASRSLLEVFDRKCAAEASGSGSASHMLLFVFTAGSIAAPSEFSKRSRWFTRPLDAPTNEDAKSNM